MIGPAWTDCLLAGLEAADSLENWFASSVGYFIDRVGISYVCIANWERGELSKLAEHGKGIGSLPWNQVGEALEQGKSLSYGTWMIIPMSGKQAASMALVVQGTKLADPSVGDQLESLVASLSRATDLWAAIDRYRNDVRRLTEIIGIAADWHASHDLNRLLEAMAQTATRLLESDRATIFLWDKPAKQLVGHPALGIEGGQLRVPEEAGVAGAVLRTKQARRWDRTDPSDEVDRRVDVKVGYRTDSLVAVPLLDQQGKAMGVFEVLNHRRGEFDEEDERTLTELARHASAALVNTQQIQQLVEIRDRLTRDAASQVSLIGSSPSIETLKGTISRVANTDLAVLILGENGTGKEVASRQIHYQSRRKHEPFVAVNCAALTETLLESELFGHEKGAFTDAHETRVGKFESASGGTLFLDEIGDMSLGGQAKLLRVLEEKVVVRVGGSKPIPVDVRIVAATNQNLVDMVRAKKFREDLYFRLTVVTLNLTPLRDRGQDVVELADFFLENYCRKVGRSKPEWSAGARSRLLEHSWPGNIRELRNLVERIVYLSTSDLIETTDLDFVSSPKSQGVSSLGSSSSFDAKQSLAEATDAFQQQLIEQHIQAAAGNMTQAAQSLGLQRSNLYRKMKQLGMHVND